MIQGSEDMAQLSSGKERGTWWTDPVFHRSDISWL